jgi:hypothetical protein
MEIEFPCPSTFQIERRQTGRAQAKLKESEAVSRMGLEVVANDGAVEEVGMSTFPVSIAESEEEQVRELAQMMIR